MCKSTTLALIAGLLIGAQAFAECKLVTDRKECPGKKDEMLKPYNNQNPTTDDVKKAKSEAECKTAGEDSAKIKRKGLIATKTVVAKWDGKDVGTYTDTKPCN